MKKQKSLGCAGCFFKLAAGSIFVITLMGMTGWLITSEFVTSKVPQGWQHPGVAGFIIALVLVAGVELATVVLSPGESTPFGILGPKSKNRTLEAMKAKGLLVQQTFHARRAFAVAEWEDEGARYFIELEDRSVLFLQGQYLYDFEPITDDPELNQPRRFPCTEFVISRDKKDRCFLQLDCKGSAFEPECTAPAFSRSDYLEGRIPNDGDILTDISYDELKAQRLNPPV